MTIVVPGLSDGSLVLRSRGGPAAQAHRSGHDPWLTGVSDGEAHLGTLVQPEFDGR